MKNPYFDITKRTTELLAVTGLEKQKHVNDDLVARTIYQTAKDNINVLAVNSYVNPEGETWSNVEFEFRYKPYGSADGTFVWRKYCIAWNHANGPLFTGIARGAYLINGARRFLENGEPFKWEQDW